MPALDLLALALPGVEVALEVSLIREVIRVRPLTPLPEAPEYVRGLVEFRGLQIPVIDLARRLAVAVREPPESAPGKLLPRGRLVICAIDTRVIAFAVDGATEIVRIDSAELQQALAPAFRAVVRGVFPRGGRALVWLDGKGLLDEEGPLPAGRLPGVNEEDPRP